MRHVLRMSTPWLQRLPILILAISLLSPADSSGSEYSMHECVTELSFGVQ